MTKLVDYELDILRSLNGEDVPGLMWGAAMGACIASLYAGGYVAREIRPEMIIYVITEKGKQVLEPHHD